ESVRCELLHEQSDVRITMVQMPALNTPQFDWCRSKMPRRAQPVPPIFQPEVAADMVVHATEHYRREYWVTWSTVRAIVGERLAAGVLDRMLGRTGFDAQQTDEADAHARPDNLWRPVPGDFRAHGRFSSRARMQSGATKFAKVRDEFAANTGMSRLGDRVLRGLAAVLAKTSS